MGLRNGFEWNSPAAKWAKEGSKDGSGVAISVEGIERRWSRVRVGVTEG